MDVLRMSVALASLGIPAALTVSTYHDPVVQRRQLAERPAMVQSLPVVKAGTSHRPDVVSGIVVKADGSALSGARVELAGNGQVVGTTTTDAAGLFAFGKIAPGVYEVRASSEGFATVITRVAVGNLPGVPLRLAVGIPLQDAEDARSVFRTAGKTASPAASPSSTRRGSLRPSDAGAPLERLQQFPSGLPRLSRRTSTPRRTTGSTTTGSGVLPTSRSPPSRRMWTRPRTPTCADTSTEGSCRRPMPSVSRSS